MKKLVALLVAVTGFLGLSAQSSSTSPGTGHWVVIDSGYQVGTTTAGSTVAPLHFYNTSTSEKIQVEKPHSTFRFIGLVREMLMRIGHTQKIFFIN
jgi:hypothetical protein